MELDGERSSGKTIASQNRTSRARPDARSTVTVIEPAPLDSTGTVPSADLESIKVSFVDSKSKAAVAGVMVWKAQQLVQGLHWLSTNNLTLEATSKGQMKSTRLVQIKEQQPSGGW